MDVERQDVLVDGAKFPHETRRMTIQRHHPVQEIMGFADFRIWVLGLVNLIISFMDI